MLKFQKRWTWVFLSFMSGMSWLSCKKCDENLVSTVQLIVERSRENVSSEFADADVKLIVNEQTFGVETAFNFEFDRTDTTFRTKLEISCLAEERDYRLNIGPLERIDTILVQTKSFTEEKCLKCNIVDMMSYRGSQIIARNDAYLIKVQVD